MDKTKLSKFLSYVLRHRPDSIGVEMDSNGWVNIEELLSKADNGLTREILEGIVAEDTKQRYAVADGRIRANQGHSVEVDLKLKTAMPPVTLYHGTYAAVVDAIKKQGLKKMKRHHVHLSADRQTAVKVGARRGKPVVLEIDTRDMVKHGVKFFISANGVWLTDFVEPKFIQFQQVTST